MVQRILCLLTIFFCSQSIYAQRPGKDSLNAWMVEPTVSIFLPGGELADRINNGNQFGLAVNYKDQANWHFGIEANFLYSSSLSDAEAVLAPLRQGEQRIYNIVGNYADVSIDHRGFDGYFMLRKTLGLWSVNPNSGLQLGLGAGATAFWYHIRSNDQSVPQIQEEYAHGYDRLSAGFALKQAIGYQYLSPKRTINFRVSLEFGQSFSEDLRGYNYAAAQKIEGRQVAFTYGLRLHWILPIYSQPANQEYFYD